MYIEKLTMNYIFLNNDNFRFRGMNKLSDEVKKQYEYEYPLFKLFYKYYRLDLNDYDDFIFDYYEDFKEIYLRGLKIKQIKYNIYKDIK